MTGGFFMLQTSEELIANSAPQWQVHQATKREAASRNKELEDQQSQSRWNRKLIEKGYAPEPLQTTESLPQPAEVLTEIINIKHEKTQKEIKASYKTLQRMNRIDASATAQNEVRRNSTSPCKLNAEEQLEANKQKQELYERLAEPLLDRDYTARAGSIIRFPTELISDVIHTAKRATASNAARFGFVSRGHEIGFYKDNTPTALLKKAGYLDNTDVEPVPNIELTDELIDLIDELSTIAVRHAKDKRPLAIASPCDFARAEALSHQIANITQKQPIDDKLTASEWSTLEDYLFGVVSPNRRNLSKLPF